MHARSRIARHPLALLMLGCAALGMLAGVAHAQNSGGSSLTFRLDHDPAPKAAPVVHDQKSRAEIIAQREYERQIRKIRARYLGSKKFEPDRERGLRELEQFTDPVAVEPLLEVLRDEQEDVRSWLLDHIRGRIDREYGQATLAYLSIYDDDTWLREESRARLAQPATDRTKWVVRTSLRSPNNNVVNNAALTVGQLKLAEMIPQLITAQVGASAGSTSGNGDLAWIQVGTTRYFVSDLQPVVGDNSAGFDPTLSPLREGTVMVIQDAIVEFRRWPVHNTLVGLVEDDYGRRVDYGFDVDRWKQWYEDEYLPQKNPTAVADG
ncbi:MAG: hypothetical protein ACF8PN_15935 [Phycisphaerales bacterium]